ncbi:MAG: ABC transporter substrate-binding protein [Clostridia bacterium]|nr:ABC transporter substrate-binding protein [Clostridia bacterium]
MKKIIVAVLLIAIMSCSIFAFAACTPADYTVGIVQHIKHVALDKSNQGFQDKLTELMTADGKTIKFIFNDAQGETANNTTAAQTLVNRKVDLIFAIATPSAQAVMAETKNIPIVFSAVTSATEAKLTADNIAGTTDLNDIKKQIDLMIELVPNATKFGVMYTTSEQNSVIQKDMAKQYMESKGITFVDGGITETDNVEQVFQSFKSQGVGCVYIPTDNKLAAAADTVHSFNTSSEAYLPIVCGEGGMNDKCGIATYGVDYYAIGVRAGEMAYEILTGKKTAKEIGYEDPATFELSVNQTVAQAIGFTIPQSVLDKLNK